MPADVPRLRVHPDNPRWFEYKGEAIALFGSGIWTIISDITVDIAEHNRWYAESGANANRVSLFAFSTREAGGRGLTPWKYTGPGRAANGRPKMDLDQWDPAFWKRLHFYLSECEQRGIIVLLQMWDEPYVEKAPDRWKLNPFNPENNVNRIPGLPGGDGPAEEQFYDPDNALLMRYQDALIRKLLDETAARYGNIIYEIGNEINMDSRSPKAAEWQRHWIDFFRQYELDHGVELLLSNDTRGDLFEADADGFDVVNHHGFIGFGIPLKEIGDTPALIGQAIRRDFDKYRKPVLNSRPLSDPDRVNYRDIPTETVGRMVYWSYLTSGGHVVGFRTTNESWKDGTVAERIIESVRTIIKRLKLERFDPHPEYSSTGLCLADPGREYVVYLPDGGSVTLDLTEAKGRLSAAWYDPRERRDIITEETAGGGGKSMFKAPDMSDWVLHLITKK